MWNLNRALQLSLAFAFTGMFCLTSCLAMRKTEEGIAGKGDMILSKWTPGSHAHDYEVLVITEEEPSKGLYYSFEDGRHFQIHRIFLLVNAEVAADPASVISNAVDIMTRILDEDGFLGGLDVVPLTEAQRARFEEATSIYVEETYVNPELSTRFVQELRHVCGTSGVQAAWFECGIPNLDWFSLE